MLRSSVVETIKQKFAATGNPTRIPLLKGDSFTANLTPTGIKVSNLAKEPFLPWIVFEETINILHQNGGRAMRGDAMGSKLGDPGLPLDSIEGHIASVVYDKSLGDSVFRRIAPIACILIWAGVCRAEPGELILLE